MPSRKRKLSTDSNTHISTNSSSTQESAKKLKLISSRPGNSIGAGTQKQKNSNEVSEPEYYTIKSILEEKRGRYLIDWEDDPTTGEQFKPTWEPKSHANAEAVADWQSRRSTGKRPSKRRTAATRASLVSAASKSSSPVTRRRNGKKVVNTPPTLSTTPSQDASPRQEDLEVQDSQPPQPLPPPSEYLAVQVSQHSSFDRDQYAHFLASGSTQDLSSSQLQHHDSGLGSSSPPQQTLAERVIGYEEAIVPDSQSLPEPAKYISTPSRFIGNLHPDLSHDIQGPAEEISSVARASTSPSQIGDLLTTAPDVADPQIAINYHRTSPSASPSPAEVLEISRAKEGDNHVGGENSSIAADLSYIPTAQSRSPLFVPLAEDLSEVRHTEIPSLQDIASPSAASDYGQGQGKVHNETQDDIASGLVFQTQVPLDLISSQQQPELESPPSGLYYDPQVPLDIDIDGLSAVELWQSGQVIPQPADHKDIAVASIESDSHELESSQIPPAPSQLPKCIESQPPDPPYSLATDNDTMAERPRPLANVHAAPPPPSSESSGVRVSLRERLKDMRARSAARHKAEKDLRHAGYDARVVALLAKRTAELDSQQSKHDIQKEVSQRSSSTSSFGNPRLGKMEYAIPLALDSRVVDQYKQTLYNYRHDIEEFVQRELGEDSPRDEKMTSMIECLIKTTIHSDLSNIMTQEQISNSDQAHWAKTCSGKFEFLGHFITAARASDMHVVIMASCGKLLDILETFLEANQAVYVRPDVMRRSDATAAGPLRFTLLATTDSSSIVSTAALVIAFDESVSTQDPRVTALRAHMLEVGTLSPLIHLLVVNSAEHIEKCLPSSLTGAQRLQALISCVAQTRHKVGQLPVGMPGPSGAAEQIAAFLSLGGREGQWTLPAMPKLEDVELFESSSMAGSSTQSVSQHSANHKRSMDPDDVHVQDSDDDYYDIAVAKRARLTPAADIIHISDSITQPSQPAPSKVVELQKTLKSAEEQFMRSLEEQLKTLRAHHASREAELQNTITTTQHRLQEHIDALSDLQYRYEARSTDLHTLRSERDAAAVATALAHRRYESQSVEIGKLKDQQRVLETELKGVRTVLGSSTVPEVAALETAKVEAVQLTADKVQLEKRLANLTKDFDFTRQQYQLASTAAAENASALSDLQTEVSALKVQASGEAVRLRQLNMATENQVHLERAKQLEAALKERDDILHRKEEELRDLKRGRGLATRASSTPRSPRLGSRASSPMPGLLAGNPMPGLLAGNGGRGGSALRFGS